MGASGAAGEGKRQGWVGKEEEGLSAKTGVWDFICESSWEPWESKVGEKSVLILVRRTFLRKSGGGTVGRGCARAAVHTYVCVGVCP